MSAAVRSSVLDLDVARLGEWTEADPPMLVQGVRVTFTPHDTMRDHWGDPIGSSVEGVVLYACQQMIVVERVEFDADTGVALPVPSFVPLRAIRTVEGVRITCYGRVRLAVMLDEVRA